MAGAYTFHDQCGFPVDMFYELCKDKNIDVDWVEFLLTGMEKGRYEECVKEMNMLESPEYADESVRAFQFGCATFGYSLEKFREYENRKRKELNERT